MDWLCQPTHQCFGYEIHAYSSSHLSKNSDDQFSCTDEQQCRVVAYTKKHVGIVILGSLPVDEGIPSMDGASNFGPDHQNNFWQKECDGQSAQLIEPVNRKKAVYSPSGLWRDLACVGQTVDGSLLPFYSTRSFPFMCLHFLTYGLEIWCLLTSWDHFEVYTFIPPVIKVLQSHYVPDGPLLVSELESRSFPVLDIPVELSQFLELNHVVSHKIVSPQPRRPQP